MNLFLCAPFYGDDRNADEVRAVMHALEDSGHSVFCFMEHVEEWGAVKLEPKTVYKRCLDEIKGSDGVVVIVADNCPGIGVEVGMARALEKPIYTFVDSEAKRIGAYLGSSTEFFTLPSDNHPTYIAQNIPNKALRTDSEQALDR